MDFFWKVFDRGIAVFVALCTAVGTYKVLYPSPPSTAEQHIPGAAVSAPWWAFALIGMGLLLGLLMAARMLWFPVSVQGKTKFRMVILGAHSFVPSTSPTAPAIMSMTGIALRVRIWNTGAPSSITDWGLKVKPLNSDAVTPQITTMPPAIYSNNPSIPPITSDQSLEAKVAAAPVAALPVEGVLLFYLQLSQETALAADTKWEIFAQDIYEKRFSVSKTVGDWLSNTAFANN